MDRLVRFNVLATSGRAVEAAGDVDTLLLDKTGTITFGNRMASEFIALPGVPAHAWRKPRCSPASPTRRRKAARSSRWPKPIMASASRISAARPDRHSLHRADPPVGHRCRRARSMRKGAVESVLRFIGLAPDKAPPEFRAGGRADRPRRRHAAGGGGERQIARPHPPEGRGQARHQGAFRRPARHGHQDGDDHRRQSAHRRRHRHRSRRRRLPRRGDAGGQAAS